jgi:hypothetical protein
MARCKPDTNPPGDSAGRNFPDTLRRFVGKWTNRKNPAAPLKNSFSL